MTTILIVDDHPALRLALRAQLSQLPDIKRITEADNGQTAVDLVRQYGADLVILDLDIPRMSGLDAVPRMRAAHPGVRVLVLTAQDAVPFAARAMQAGAQGFVSKTQDLEAIVRCVQSVLGGFTVFPSSTPRDMPRDPQRDGQSPNDTEGLGKLTDKEMEVLRMLTRGMTNKAIGKALFISNKTVSSYKTRIMNKLGAESLVDLVDFARRCRLVP